MLHIVACADPDRAVAVATRINLFSAFMSAGAHALWFLVIHHVLRFFSPDRTFYSHAIVRPLAAEVLADDGETAAASGGELTEREREILALLAQGMSNKRIAERLGISEYTVRNHVRQITAKLGAANRSEAAVLAVQRGLAG